MTPPPAQLSHEHSALPPLLLAAAASMRGSPATLKDSTLTVKHRGIKFCGIKFCGEVGERMSEMVEEKRERGETSVNDGLCYSVY